jgi:lon-related putative ATP-dependent protease
MTIIGQDRAREALRMGLNIRAEGYNIFVTGEVGGGRTTTVRRMLDEIELGDKTPCDFVFVQNFADPDRPHQLSFPAGRGISFKRSMRELMEGLLRDLPQVFDSELYQRQRAEIVEAAGQEQKAKLRDFEVRVQTAGFVMVQVQMGPVTRPNIVPSFEGNPVDFDELEQLAEDGKFPREKLEPMQESLSELRMELESLGKSIRRSERELRRHLTRMDKDFARPLLDEAIGDLRDAFDEPGVAEYLAGVAEGILGSLEELRHVEGSEEAHAEAAGEIEYHSAFDVNVVVDHSQTKGRPIIWEKAPSYRNLFGTIEKFRTAEGEWLADHTHIRAGSLLRANGGFLVLDAMDVLVEPGVWAALKRTMRTGETEIQSFDPMNVMAGNGVKPEPVPIDVKVIIIGTRQTYSLLHQHDEDFSKIFKVKAAMAMSIPHSEQELLNYASFVHKKTVDEQLPPFRREAVATVVEQAMRLAEHREKLTTQFAEIADLILESGFWARQNGHTTVLGSDVDAALRYQVERVSLIEEMMRERIEQGHVLIDVGGEKVGQVNGLAVLDTGDHSFGLPSRITATTAVGRGGIIDLERESQMSGSLHTKGVLILTGFLRERFAKQKPLALTATICFEQNYGGVDGDSASSTELYALLSSLSGVPLRQGIAVTGSVNQRGEVQPIGGVNEKVEGFFDVCRIHGLSGEQGVLIPDSNVQNLMLRKDVVEAVENGEFHIWAVKTIEQGLAVLTGRSAGLPEDGALFEPGSIYSAVDKTLQRLASEVARFGVADGRV